MTTAHTQSVPGSPSTELLVRTFLTPVHRPTPPRELAWLGGARTRRVRFDEDRSLAVYEWGPTDAPGVLLVHGWSGRGSQLGAFVAPLLERGRRVIAFDAPGHGRSDGGLTGLPELVTAVERVLEAHEGITAAIAHSMGAGATTVAMSRGHALERVAYLAPPENAEGYLRRVAFALGVDAEATLRARERIEAYFGVPFAALRGSTHAPAMRAALAIFHDPVDEDVPIAEAERIAAAWPRAELHRVQGVGHTRIARDPHVVERAVEFILRGDA